jgi:uncharacterized protein (TIGR02147 family)
VAARSGPDVFSFLGYREFLRAHYADKKRLGLSFRSFSRRAGLRSPNYLKLVMDGERNLSTAMADRFARACGLTGPAADYFRELVVFEQAGSADERADAHERLLRFRRYRAARRIDVAQDEYHSRWYLPAIRELAARHDFRDDAHWIAEELIPPIKPLEAERALRTLIELGMLVRDEHGQLRQETALVTTGAETHAVHVADFHRTMMARAADSLVRIDPSERDISALTLCVGEGTLARIKQRIAHFRRELLELSELEADPVRVVQVNFQLFPLSRGTRGVEQSK